MEPTQTNNASAKIISALIIGLLVGFAAGVFWQDRRSSSSPGTAAGKTEEQSDKQSAAAVLGATSDGAKDEQKATPTAPAATTGSLTAADQPAGNTVEVSGVDADDTVWVAVREVINGSVGNILGAQKVFTGRDQNVTVYLLRPTVSGGSYRVVVYREAGTPAFDRTEDVLVEGVEADFTAK